MASNKNITLLLVPGAYFKPQVFDRLVEALKGHAYKDVIVASYLSTNPEGDPHKADCAADTAYIRKKYLVPLLDAGKDVVIFAHSYGGMPAAGAASGLSKRTRTKSGEPGGVVGLIMAGGFVVGEGLSLAACAGGDVAPWVIKDQPREGLCLVHDPYKVFASDVSRQEADEMLKFLVPHALVAFLSPQQKPAFSERDFEGLCGYVKQTEDLAIPVQVQEIMLQNSGTQWVTRELVISHNAGFVTRTDEMATLIDEMIGMFIEGLRR